jgi:hypothetical protein
MTLLCVCWRTLCSGLVQMVFLNDKQNAITHSPSVACTHVRVECCKAQPGRPQGCKGFRIPGFPREKTLCKLHSYRCALLSYETLVSLKYSWLLRRHLEWDHRTVTPPPCSPGKYNYREPGPEYIIMRCQWISCAKLDCQSRVWNTAKNTGILVTVGTSNHRLWVVCLSYRSGSASWNGGGYSFGRPSGYQAEFELLTCTGLVLLCYANIATEPSWSRMKRSVKPKTSCFWAYRIYVHDSGTCYDDLVK